MRLIYIGMRYGCNLIPRLSPAPVLVTCSMQIQTVGGGEGLGTRLVRLCTHVSLLSLFNIGLHNCLLEETQVFNAFNSHMAKKYILQI